MADEKLTIRFSSEGLSDLKSAIKSIRDDSAAAMRDQERDRRAAQRAAVAQAKEEVAQVKAAAKAKADAEKAAAKETTAATKAAAKEKATSEKEAAADRRRTEFAAERAHQKSLTALAKAEAKERAEAAKPRDAFGNLLGRGGDRGLRQISSTRLLDSVLGHTASQLLGFQGVGGQILGAVNVFRSALSAAASALTQFGSYVLSDIIKPQLRLETNAAQIANRIGGGVSGASVGAAINDLYAKNPQADLDQVTKAYGAAADLTKDSGKASEVTDLALMANKAYGLDLNKMVEYIGKKRAALPSLSEDAFGALMSSQIASSAKGSASIEDLAGTVGKQEAIAAKFGAYGGPEDYAGIAQKETQIASIINAGTSKGMSGAQATTGLANLVADLQRDPKKFGGMVGPDGQLQRLDVIIPKLIATAGGNLNAYAPGKKGGALADVQIGALSQGSRNFLDSLQLADAYKGAGGGDAGTKAVSDKLAAIFDTATAGSQLLDDTKKVEATTSMQLEQAWRDLKVSLTASLLPVLQTEGPKFAAALKGLVEQVSKVDLVGTFETIMSGLAGVIYDVMKLTGKGDPETVKKLGQIAGVLPKEGEIKASDPTIIDRLKNPEQHQLTGGRLMLNGFLHPGDTDANQLAEPVLGVSGVLGTIGGRGTSRVTAGTADGGVTPSLGAGNQGLGSGQKMDDAAGKLSKSADQLAQASKTLGLDLARFMPIGGRPIVQ